MRHLTMNMECGYYVDALVMQKIVIINATDIAGEIQTLILERNRPVTCYNSNKFREVGHTIG